MIGELLAGLIRANLALAAAVVAVLAMRGLVRPRFGAQAAYGLWLAPLAAALAAAPVHPAPPTPIVPALASAAGTAEAFVAQAAQAAPAMPAAGPSLAALAVLAWALGAAGAAALMLRRQARFTAAMGPALVGVVRPRIVTPPDFEARYGPEERRLILAHEAAHLARGDTLANALACLVQCLCWFNPLTHVAARAMRIDQEFACDALVIGRFPRERRAYAELLLKTQLSTVPLPLGCYWPPGAEHPLKARIAMLKSPLPDRPMRALGALVAASLAVGAAGLAWSAQPGAAIANNGHLEPAEAAKLVGPGETMLCKPDERRELHNCRIFATPFTKIATAADVARAWPAAARKAGLTGYVVLQCDTNREAGRLDHCSGYHYGGAAERPELKAAFEQAAVRVISIIRLKTNPGADVAPMSKRGFYTIEFNDHPHMPGDLPGDHPATRFPDFLPGPPKPASAPRAEAAPRLLPARYAPATPATATLLAQPEWLEKPTMADLVAAYPAADQDKLGGVAVLACRLGADGRLTGCRVAAETPPEDGFGAAALKLAPLFRARLTTPDGAPVAGMAIRIPFRFQGPHGGPSQGVSLYDPATITRPVWTEKPTAADIARLYPPEAVRKGLSATVVMNCRVGADGRLAECGIAKVPGSQLQALPEPIAMDFGTATLQLAKLFRMEARAGDGKETTGGVIHIPVRWEPPGASAKP